MRDHAPASSLSNPQTARDFTRRQGRIARDFRVGLCLSQVELAASINATATDVSMLERGLYPLGGRTDDRMSRLFAKVQSFCEAQAAAPARHTASLPTPERSPRSTKVPSSGNFPSVPARTLGLFEGEVHRAKGADAMRARFKAISEATYKVSVSSIEARADQSCLNHRGQSTKILYRVPSGSIADFVCRALAFVKLLEKVPNGGCVPGYRHDK